MAATQIASGHVWGRMRSQLLILRRDRDPAALHAVRSPQAEGVALLRVCFPAVAQIALPLNAPAKRGVQRRPESGRFLIVGPRARSSHGSPPALAYFPSRAPAASQP